MLRAICLFTDLQELPSDGDSLLVFARLVKVNNLPIEGISLGGVLRLSRQAGCHPQRAMQNKHDCQCVPGQPETKNLALLQSNVKRADLEERSTHRRAP